MIFGQFSKSCHLPPPCIHKIKMSTIFFAPTPYSFIEIPERNFFLLDYYSVRRCKLIFRTFSRPHQHPEPKLQKNNPHRHSNIFLKPTRIRTTTQTIFLICYPQPFSHTHLSNKRYCTMHRYPHPHHGAGLYVCA